MKHFVIFLVSCSIIMMTSCTPLDGTWVFSNCRCDPPTNPNMTNTLGDFCQYFGDPNKIKWDFDGGAATEILVNVSQAHSMSVNFGGNLATNNVVFPTGAAVCTGAIFRESKCQVTDFLTGEEGKCHLSFSCQEGDCVMHVVGQNLKLYMQPISAIVAFVLWIVFAFFGRSFPLDLILKGIAILMIILGILLLFGPSAYGGILLAATGAFVFKSSTSGVKWTFFAVALTSSFLFVQLLNIAPTSYTTASTTALFGTWSSQQCFSWMGAPIQNDGQCRQWILALMIFSWVAVLLQPIVIMALLFKRIVETKEE